MFKDPSSDLKTFNFDLDVALADKLDNGTINATDPNLKPFQARGGKRYDVSSGWNDQLIAPGNSLNYYKNVVEVMGARKTDAFFRLFMAPGMAHCAGGPGPNTLDALAALEQWVEHGKAPTRSSLLEAPAAKWSELALCAHIRRSRNTKGRGVLTMQQTSSVRRLEVRVFRLRRRSVMISSHCHCGNQVPHSIQPAESRRLAVVIAQRLFC